MDFGTIAGLIIAMVLIALGVGFNLGPLYDAPSVAIVFGGVFGAMFIGYPAKTVIGIFKVMGKAFKPPKVDNIGTIDVLVKFSEKARREGLLSLEAEIAQIEDAFLKKGLQMVVDGTDTELVKNILDRKLPYEANLFMVDKEGMIIAMPEKIESLLGLKELKEHLYTDSILKTIYKPEEFNILTNKSPFASHFKNLLENETSIATLKIEDKE